MIPRNDSLTTIKQANRWQLTSVVAVILLCLHVAMVAWSASQQSPTIDEPVHLSSGVWNWTTGNRNLNRGNPPLIDLIAAAPVVLLNPEVDWRRMPSTFLVAEDFYEANGERSYWLTTVGRWALLPFTILGGIVSWTWAGRLYGTHSGLLALAMWCFCPLIIGNAELVTGDMGSTALILTTCYCFWRWQQSPTWPAAVTAGLVLGLAELSKYVAIVLYPLLPTLWLLGCFCRRNEVSTSSLKRKSIQVLVMLMLSIYVINLGYLFDGTGTSLGSYSFLDRFASGVDLEEGNGSLLAILKSIPMPFPDNYLRGIDEILTVGSSGHRMYFAGTWKEGGWWYYYILGLGVKLPLGMLSIISLAVIAAICRKEYRVRFIDEMAVLLPCGTLSLFVTMATSIQYLRYALPVLPFVFISCSRVAIAFHPKKNAISALTCVATVWFILATIRVFPHCGSYFNEIAGGPKNGHSFMLESSIDWGQDVLYLKKWLHRNPEAKPFHLGYFGHCDPRLAGVGYQLPPTLSEMVLDRGESLIPGWYAVSVSLLRGFSWAQVPDGKGQNVYIGPEDFSYFLDIEPTSRAGYSINIYHLDAARIETIRDKWFRQGRAVRAPSPDVPSVTGHPKRQAIRIPGLENLDNCFSPTLTSDLNEIVFAKLTGAATGFDLYLSRRASVIEAFRPPVRIENTVGVENDVYPALSPDGLELLFVQSDAKPQIMYSNRKDLESDFSPATRLEVTADIEGDSRIGTPQFVDQDTIVFSRIDSATGERTLWASNRVSGGEFGGPVIYAAPEGGPTVYFNSDGRRAYFGGVEGAFFVIWRSSLLESFGKQDILLSPEMTGPFDGTIWVAPKEDVAFYCSPGPGRKIGDARQLWMIRF